MPEPRFVTNSNFGSPGVYIRELKPQPGVRGLATNTIGIVGTAVRGPVGRPVRVNSYGEFAEIFGERDYGAGGPIRSEIWRALVGKSFGPMVISRVVAADSATATRTFVQGATEVLSISASSPGAWGNGLTVSIAPASDKNPGHFNLTAKWNGTIQLYRNLDLGTDNLSKAVSGFGDAALVRLAKVADGRPDDIADAPLDGTAGADGLLLDSDYTAEDGPIDQIAGYKGLKAVFVAGRSTAAVKAKLALEAAQSNDRVFLCCPDDETVGRSAAILDERSLSPSDRLVYCFNHTKIFDPETSEQIWVEPTGWMASVLSQTDDDVHPGDADNAGFLAAVVDLAFPSLRPGDYDQFTAEGIAALERSEDGFVFVDAPTVDGEQLAYRLMLDFLIRSIARRINDDVKKANTQERRDKTKGDIEAFLGSLARQGRFIDREPNGDPAVSVDTESRNTKQGRDAGIQITLVTARLIPFQLVVVLEVLMGTNVQIKVAA